MCSNLRSECGSGQLVVSRWHACKDPFAGRGSIERDSRWHRELPLCFSLDDCLYMSLARSMASLTVDAFRPICAKYFLVWTGVHHAIGRGIAIVAGHAFVRNRTAKILLMWKLHAYPGLISQ